MDQNSIDKIKEKINEKSTEDLLKTWQQNDREQWSDEAFEAIRRILIERNVSLPKQLELKDNGKKEKVIQVQLPDNEIREFEDFEKLREDIIAGNIKRDYKARVVVNFDNDNKNGKDKKKEEKWSVLKKVVNTDFKLHSLYNPIWAHTVKGFGVGAVVGIALKALDTTFLYLMVDPIKAFVWILVIASVLISKWWKWAFLLAIVISFSLGVKGYLFLTLIVVMLVGAIFGGSAGMVFGTVIGHFRHKKLAKASDYYPEGKKPYLLGLLLPLSFFVITFSFYIFFHFKYFG